MSAEIRQSVWKHIDYDTILFDHWNKRRVIVIWTDEVIDAGWAQPCYGKNGRWDKAPNYLRIKVLSCDEGHPFVEEWKITRYENSPLGKAKYGRIHTQEDHGEHGWKFLGNPRKGFVQDGHDYFESGVDIILDDVGFLWE